MNEFKIAFSTELCRNETSEVAGILEDEVSKLTYSIFTLQKIFEWSEWYIILGDVAYKFTFDEIPLIWDKIPKNLKQVVSNDLDSIWFTFVEQGNDKALVVEKSTPDHLLVSLIGTKYNPLYAKYAYSNGYSLDDLAPQRVRVSKQYFVNEWRNFVLHTLHILIEHKLIDEDEPSVKEFLNQIPIQ
ncbi:MAG: hypothetical protein R3E39_23875 [Anaerolineae bacterium]